jgi:hypothetical protein
MEAAVVRQNAAARNSTSLLVEDAGRLRVTQNALPSGGVKAEVQLSEETADPIQDVIDRLVSVYTFKANVLSLRTADKMVGTVLDLKA